MQTLNPSPYQHHFAANGKINLINKEIKVQTTLPPLNTILFKVIGLLFLLLFNHFFI